MLIVSHPRAGADRLRAWLLVLLMTGAVLTSCRSGSENDAVATRPLPADADICPVLSPTPATSAVELVSLEIRDGRWIVSLRDGETGTESMTTCPAVPSESAQAVTSENWAPHDMPSSPLEWRCTEPGPVTYCYAADDAGRLNELSADPVLLPTSQWASLVDRWLAEYLPQRDYPWLVSPSLEGFAPTIYRIVGRSQEGCIKPVLGATVISDSTEPGNVAYCEDASSDDPSPATPSTTLVDAEEVASTVRSALLMAQSP